MLLHDMGLCAVNRLNQEWFPPWKNLTYAVVLYGKTGTFQRRLEVRTPVKSTGDAGSNPAVGPKGDNYEDIGILCIVLIRVSWE